MFLAAFCDKMKNVGRNDMKRFVTSLLTVVFVFALLSMQVQAADSFDEGYADGLKGGRADAAAALDYDSYGHMEKIKGDIWADGLGSYREGFLDGYLTGFFETPSGDFTDTTPSYNIGDQVKDKPTSAWGYNEWKKYLEDWQDYFLSAVGYVPYEEFLVISSEYEEAQEAYKSWFEGLPIQEQWNIREKRADALEEEFRIYAEIARREAEKAAAKAKAEAAAYAAKPIILKVNGVTIKTDSPPVIEDGRTLAPARAVAEALGNYVSWDSTTQTIGIYSYATEVLLIQMRIGSNRAKVLVGDFGGIYDERILDVPAKLINGRTMVPVRFIAEALGCSVNWDQQSKTVSITQGMG